LTHRGNRMYDLNALTQGLNLLMDPYVLLVILASAVYGLFVGALPGLTATMAVALLVPVTFFMDPVPALSAIVTMSTMAIFAGDIPTTLLRIPGTPSSAAYVEDSYRLTQQGKSSLVLGIDVTMSAIGGIIGAIILILLAPALAEVAIKFSTFEYFWLACIGLSCAVMVSSGSTTKAMLSLLIGLLLNSVGMDVTLGYARFTMGYVELLDGFAFIPVMIGMFGIVEIFRNVLVEDSHLTPITVQTKHIFKGMARLIGQYWRQITRSGLLGTAVGILPGAGADIAAWVSYGFSKRLSKHPEKYGTGHVEGIVNATSANNAAVSGAWVPALVFGIPGDSITAITIGVLYMKGLNPGPDIFMRSPEVLYAVYAIFILANLLLVPFGWVAIKVATRMLLVPKKLLYPVILIFCIVGAFAINNALTDVLFMLIFGIVAYFMVSNDIPVAPAILGLVLGDLLENSFMVSMIKSDWDLTAFFERPISAFLGVLALLTWLTPFFVPIIKRKLGLGKS